MILHSLDKHRDKGLLILRVGIGIAFMLHGWPKLIGGPDKWQGLGGAVGALGISLGPAPATIMGFMAAFAEFGGGLLLAIGLFVRPALFLLFSTMFVATAMKMGKADATFRDFAHPLELAIVFLSLIFIGPGKYSLDDRLSKKTKSEQG